MVGRLLIWPILRRYRDPLHDRLADKRGTCQDGNRAGAVRLTHRWLTEIEQQGAPHPVRRGDLHANARSHRLSRCSAAGAARCAARQSNASACGIVGTLGLPRTPAAQLEYRKHLDSRVRAASSGAAAPVSATSSLWPLGPANHLLHLRKRPRQCRGWVQLRLRDAAAPSAVAQAAPPPSGAAADIRRRPLRWYVHCRE